MAREPHHDALIVGHVLMRIGLGATCTMLLSACTTSSMQADHPAVIAEATEASRTALLNIVRSALNTPSVKLADSALTKDNVLIVERTPRRDVNGQLLNGRVLEMPETFVLTSRNSRCVLAQKSTGREWSLPHTKCIVR